MNKLEDSLAVFDYGRFMEDGAIVAGGKGSGKSTLCQSLVAGMSTRWLIRVFDLSRVWESSSISLSYEGNPRDVILPRFTEDSAVYDLSRLYVSQIQALVYNLLEREWQTQIRESQPAPKVYVFEEGQIYFKPQTLRSKRAEEALRLITVGRNFACSYLAITQRPQTLDNTVWELCGQRYVGRIMRESQVMKDILGKQAKTLNTLERGQFIYNVDGKNTLTSFLPRSHAGRRMVLFHD